MKLDPIPPSTFQEKHLPSDARLVGLAALVHGLSISAPVRRPATVSSRHVRGSRRDENGWRVFDKRYWPGDHLADHLAFAVRHEDIDLLVLKRIFQAVAGSVIESIILQAPTGGPARRLWFLYEMLTDVTLEIPETPKVVAIDLLDPKAYFTGKPKLSRRHRVRDNLLGGGNFCPMVRRTSSLVASTEAHLGQRARETVGRTGAHLVARAASFLLLADSRASFEIEGERAPRNRLERWGRAVLQAGKNELDREEILRLHRVLIEDNRFVDRELRRDGVFLGERDHEGTPLPDFIGARPEDLADLLSGLLNANRRMRDDGVDPVLQAATTAFGFVYVHPFQDGNGRLHRCLIHHVLAERKFTPTGLVFPVSSVMLDRIDEYRTALRSHSAPLMPFIEWRPTPDRNAEVLNDTADLYRFFDCTEAAEFLYACVLRTVEHDLPREIDYLRRHDEAIRRIMDTVEMPDRVAENFLLFVRQNDGALPKKRRKAEFAALSDQEVGYLERIISDVFDGFDGSRDGPKGTR